MQPIEDEKALLESTRPFTHEDVARSWRETAVTFFALSLAAFGAACAPWAPARLGLAALEGLLIVRAFILYHDVMHNALHRGSKAARALYSVFGVWVLTPPKVWRQTHNYHHANTAKIIGSHIGGFPMLTTELWERATPLQRRMYRVTRHPLNVVFAYVTVFLYGMCLSSFLRGPRKHWDSLVALIAHFVGLGAATWAFGASTVLTAWVLPQAIACSLGALLFYLQHTVPDLYVAPRERWSYVTAALRSSSFLVTGPVMQWFTGNIGFHHVHHLNPGIPFYRLPEAMAALPALQDPPKVSLAWKDLRACFSLNLWDPTLERMVPYPAANTTSA